MSRSLALLIVLFSLPAGAQQVYTVERTPAEGDTMVILLGRACRAATDQDWITVCTAAINQAAKESEARKKLAPAPPSHPTPAEPKKEP